MGIIVGQAHLHDGNDPLQCEVQELMAQVKQLKGTAEGDVGRENNLQMLFHFYSVEVGDDILIEGGIFLSEEHFLQNHRCLLDGLGEDQSHQFHWVQLDVVGGIVVDASQHLLSVLIEILNKELLVVLEGLLSCFPQPKGMYHSNRYHGLREGGEYFDGTEWLMRWRL